MNIDFVNPEIKFYFSFQCPYSFMAWEMMKSLFKSSKVPIAPIEVGLFPTGNTKYHFREIWAEPRWKRLVEDAKSCGLTISRPEKYVSSINASRAIEAFGAANAPDYISSVFRAVFVARVEISLVNPLRLHLQSDGIDSSIFAAALENPETEKKAVSNTLLWGHNRIRMLPTIEFEDERLSGFIDKGSLERFLRAVLD